MWNGSHGSTPYHYYYRSLEQKENYLCCCMYIRVCQKFGIKVYWRLQFLGYLRTLSLKFQKAGTKIEAVLTLPCWLSQFSWDSQLGSVRTASILVRAFWNFKLRILKYSRNCSFQYTLIPNFWHPLTYIVYLLLAYNKYRSLTFRMYQLYQKRWMEILHENAAPVNLLKGKQRRFSQRLKLYEYW